MTHTVFDTVVCVVFAVLVLLMIGGWGADACVRVCASGECLCVCVCGVVYGQEGGGM